MERPVTLVLAATTPALGIGKNGALPWRLKKEMTYFRQVTEGGIVIMGRKTWESIPPKFRPLKDRVNVVVSRDPALSVDDGVLTATSFQDALTRVFPLKGKIFVIGGGQLYATALEHPATKSMLLTQIQDSGNKFQCDTFFNFNQNAWQKRPFSELRAFVGPNVSLESSTNIENDVSYEFTLWTKA